MLYFGNKGTLLSSFNFSKRLALSTAIFLISLSIISYCPGPVGFVNTSCLTLFSFGKAMDGAFFLINSYFGVISYF